MRLTITLLLLLLAVGCRSSSSTTSQTDTPTISPTKVATPVPAVDQKTPLSNSATQITSKVDACSLLTSSDIESVQGQPVKETKLSGESAQGLTLSQCFFTLPTFTNSISLVVAQKGEGGGGQEPREFWRETFHEKKSEKDREREHEEEEESSPPQRIAGIGDEAFWMGSRVGGALYVLKGNSYIRVSVGGPVSQSEKMRRSKDLAKKVLARLS